MIKLPLEEIKKQIIEQSKISEKELDEKIKNKIQSLSGLISDSGAAYIIANELSVKLEEGDNSYKLRKLLPGMKDIQVAAKVMRKFDINEFQNQRGAGKVGSIVIADETDSVRAVFWHDKTDLFQKFNENDILLIKKATVKERNGNPEIHINDNSEIEINPEGIEIKETKAHIPNTERKEICKLDEGEQNIEIIATIVQIFDIRFFFTCPLCRKRAFDREDKIACSEHGEIEPQHNYVLNLVLDDGTDNIRTIFWKKQIEKLLNKTEQEILEFKDHPEKFEDIKTELLGEIIKVIGRTNKNEMFDRLEFSVQMVLPKPTPEEELAKSE